MVVVPVLFGAVDAVKEAKNVILDLLGEVEEGGIYEGTVIEIRDFGAVIELLRNKEGLLHVSEIADTKEKHSGGKSLVHVFTFHIPALLISSFTTSTQATWA